MTSFLTYNIILNQLQKSVEGGGGGRFIIIFLPNWPSDFKRGVLNLNRAPINTPQREPVNVMRLPKFSFDLSQVVLPPELNP